MEFLEEEQISSIGYHGKMDAAERRNNQERWMSDEVRVLVGTIAFGLGINKASVRAVVHLALPKSIEQYYQEAGPGGPGWATGGLHFVVAKKGCRLLAYFADQIIDSAEKERAWQRYHSIRGFADSKGCRHRQICLHFGENPKWKTCGACDACGCESEWLVKSIKAQATASLPSARPVKRQIPDVDSELRDYLREWRKAISKQQGIPAFVVMHDSTLEEVCRKRPSSMRELLGISGFGEYKGKVYGQQIFDALERFRAGLAPVPRLNASRLRGRVPVVYDGGSLTDNVQFQSIQRGLLPEVSA